MEYFGLKLSQDLGNRAAHPYQEFRGLNPPPPPRAHNAVNFRSRAVLHAMCSMDLFPTENLPWPQNVYFIQFNFIFISRIHFIQELYRNVNPRTLKLSTNQPASRAAFFGVSFRLGFQSPSNST